MDAPSSGAGYNSMSARRIVSMPLSFYLRVSAAPVRHCAVSAQRRAHDSSSWKGLSEWRSFVDTRRGLGPTGITDAIRPDWEVLAEDTVLPATLAEQAVVALNTADPCLKAAVTHRIFIDLNLMDDVKIGHANAPDCASPTTLLFCGCLRVARLAADSTHAADVLVLSRMPLPHRRPSECISH